MSESPAPTPDPRRPEPIPLDVKVVLLGSTSLYHLLYGLDPDFRDLFKIKAHFAPELDWSADHERNYAAFVSRCVRDGDLLHFDRGAVARVIEYGGRLRESQRKLSARLQDVSDLVTEASVRARQSRHELVLAEDVDLAVLKSPIVGTFYRSPEPGAASFTDVGSRVKKGQVLCIIEAMKLMNEITADVDGEVVKIFVDNGQAVQYGERLFAIRPN